MNERWRWRGSVALLAVALAFFLYPLLPNDDVINSDWPAFATGARLIISDPGHLYDLDAQQRVQLDVTGGRTLVTLGIHGILPFLVPAWVAPLAGAVILARRWQVLAGWATADAGLLATTAILNPRWVLDWLGQTRATVAPASREVDLPHLGVLLPGQAQTIAVAVLTLVAIALVVYLARRRRDDFRATAAVLVAGGVLAAPHALPADLVLVAVAMAVWGRARWFDWLGLSVAALVAALTPAPVPAVVGIACIGWVCVRAAGVASRRSIEPVPASAR